jgi:hypothetical protein
LKARLLDRHGKLVPESEYDLELGDKDDFVFRLKNPSREMSGRYKIVLSNDTGESEADINVNFLGMYGTLLQYCTATAFLGHCCGLFRQTHSTTTCNSQRRLRRILSVEMGCP